MIWNQMRRIAGMRRSRNLPHEQVKRFSALLRPRKAMKPPELLLERENGSHEPVTVEEDLYRYTRHRWLFNEQNELSRHYLRFNLQKLVEVAVGVVGEGSKACTKVLKCVEGLHNKAFILTMDNGVEVFAKLPNPNAGPARYNTASEVATKVFLRDVAKVPVPRVFAWSSDPNNPVQAEYIIEEKAPGARLGGLWHQWPRESKLDVISQVADIDHALSSIEFHRHGCIYFREDLPVSDAKQNGSLLADSMFAPDVTGRFTIGPVTTAELWKSNRDKMDLDRGPWETSHEYAYAAAYNEMEWIKTHATPRMNYYRSMKEPELPEDGVSLLSRYMKAIPYLIPQDRESSANVLWHPDLHLDNVFVDPDTCKITCIVDWQGASVAPLFYQSSVPRMFRHDGPVREGWVVPTRPEDFDSLNKDEKQKVDEDLENETMHKFYEAMVNKRAPRHWSVLRQLKDVQLKRSPTWLVTGVWENRDLFFFRQSLIAIAAHWDRLRPSEDVGCPLEFTKQEMEQHSKEDENMDGVGQMLKLFRDQGILPVDGMVAPEEYETAKSNCKKFKEVFLNSTKDAEERELFSKLWPYQDQEA